MLQERLYVGAVKGGGHLAVITAGGVQMRRQPGDGGNDALDPGVGPFAPVAGYLVSGPALDRLPEPLLADTGERQRARRPEYGQVPHVGRGLGGRVAGRGPHVAGQGPADLALLPCHRAGRLPPGIQ